MNNLKKILVAEDDASMRRYLEVILQSANYQVVLAEDGLSALQIALTEEFDLVVLDGIMPNMTGYDLARSLKNNVKTQNLPIILLSGLDSLEVDSSLANAYLSKDENLSLKLLQSVSQMLQK